MIAAFPLGIGLLVFYRIACIELCDTLISLVNCLGMGYFECLTIALGNCSAIK